MGRRLRTREARNASYYPLRKVRELIDAGAYVFAPIAQQTAFRDFGWNEEEMKHALLKLQRDDFWETNTGRYDRNTMIDFYKAYDLMGEDVFIHFQIEDGNLLVVTSFKRITA